MEGRHLGGTDARKCRHGGASSMGLMEEKVLGRQVPWGGVDTGVFRYVNAVIRGAGSRGQGVGGKVRG